MTKITSSAPYGAGTRVAWIVKKKQSRLLAVPRPGPVYTTDFPGR